MNMEQAMKNITLLGSTGSIGVNALKVIRENPGQYRLMGLAAGRNIRLLSEQIRFFKPDAVSVLDEAFALLLEKELKGSYKPRIDWGNNGYTRLASMDGVDTVISAMSGAAGLLPTYAAVKTGKKIALANKETMVMAGPIIMSEAEKQGVSIFPVDSEHSAIFQSLQGHETKDVKRVILTASGGPFRNFSLDAMQKITPTQALDHPNWDMGEKISIDSATLMNKGLEVIEAKWLFNLKMDQIRILIHPQSIVHSMVEYQDGSTIAQLGIPDMYIPISYALSYPRHKPNPLPTLELDQVGDLSFSKPDLSRFRCLALALQAANTGGSMPAVLNGANEIAVDAFLKEEIRFLDIPELIEKTMNAHEPHAIENIEMVMAADNWARNTAREVLSKWQ